MGPPPSSLGSTWKSGHRHARLEELMALPMPPIDHPEPGHLNGHHPTDRVSPVRNPPFFAVEPPIRPHKLFLHLILFLATLGTATFFYAALEGADPFTNPASLVNGLPFSLPLMLILLSH